MSKYFRIRGIEEDEIFRNLFIDYYPNMIYFGIVFCATKCTGSNSEASFTGQESYSKAYRKKQGQTHMEKGCKDLRIFIIQGNIIKKFDTEYGFADVKLSK